MDLMDAIKEKRERMARLLLVSGENNSGKSRFAEQLIGEMTGKRYYIATMKSCTRENEKRIEKHRRQREGLAFQTLELPFEVGNAPIEADAVVLLEDVSNLLANVLFEQKGTEEEVYRDLLRLGTRCGVLVAVTITGLDPEAEAGYDEETKTYIRALNHLNARLAGLAETVFPMQEGKPVGWKGGSGCVG